MTIKAELLKTAKPILFSTEMARALLEGRKTQTRRVVAHDKRTPTLCGRDKLYKMVDTLNGKPFFGAGFYKDSDVFEYEGKVLTDAIYFKARYQPGDILWVRETWRESYHNALLAYEYKADPPRETDYITPFTWRPSIHMPKEAARIFLRMTDVRVERVQEISEEDAREEGYPFSYKTGCVIGDYMALWNSLNAKRGYGWHTNPWVWVYELERVIPEEDAV